MSKTMAMGKLPAAERDYNAYYCSMSQADYRAAVAAGTFDPNHYEYTVHEMPEVDRATLRIDPW